MAYKVTKNARHVAAAKRGVLYHSTQHAREWIATEVERRLFPCLLAHERTPPPASRRS